MRDLVQYYIDEMNGEVALLIDRVKYYLDNDKEQEFIEKYGCELLLKDKSLNPKARQKILAEYQEQSVVTYKHEGNTVGSLDNRFRHYMDEKGILYSTDIKIYDTAPETTEINRLLYEGKNVNICVDNFDLYDENGTIKAENVGEHWMTITGTMDDGRCIVSSWGKQYYINLSEMKNPNFFITNIFPK